MAAVTYTVKRGDSLWKICSSSEWGPKISGNNTQAKINTLVSLNGLANANLIYPGQVLTLSSSGGASASSTAQTTQAPSSNCVTIDILALKAESTTGRDVFAYWRWSKPNTKGFKIRWEYDTVVDGKTQTQYEESETSTPGVMYSEFSVPEEVRPYNNWVQVFITPIAEFVKDSSGNDTKYRHWTADEVGKQYHFKDNPPFTPEKPTCEIEDSTLTMKIESIAKEKDAASIIFQVIKDNTSAIYTSPAIPVVQVTDDYGTVSHQYTVPLGSNYKVRAKAVATNGKQSGWTEFSEEAETKPTAPGAITTYKTDTYKEADGTTKHKVYLEWPAVPSASKYKVQCAVGQTITEDSYRDVATNLETTSATILDVDIGNWYNYRIVAITKSGLESDPSEVLTIVIGTPPGKPTTWSTSESAFEGDSMELNWIHNSTDGSVQTYAQIGLKIGEGAWFTLDSYLNDTDSSSDEEKIVGDYAYGKFISYKGNLYFKMDTSNSMYQNKKIQWQVRTAGIERKFSDEAWSDLRTIYIYEKPRFEMSMIKDVNGTTGMIETLDSFPFYVKGKAAFDSQDYSVQKPVGYHVRIVANESYTTVDDIGNTKTINQDDAVFERYIDTSDPLELEISANDVDLESGIPYILYCTLDLSTGLTLTGAHEFDISWATDVSYNIVANIAFDKNTFTARISPYAVNNSDGSFVKDTTLAVYRREYNGKYTQIATGIPNTNTSVTDPHPALDYARYRIVAKDSKTGATSFYDPPSEPIKYPSIIIQWNEDWNTFDISDEYSVEGPAWSGSLLELKYNVEVADNRSREVAMVKYAGRESPVTYYGTHITEAPSWNVTIPKDDKETIYALRRLSIWGGDVYIREPSGMGYWANVKVNFNQKYKEVTTQVTLNITKVEGGV